ncbi:NAD(P)-dependent glycerol-3-phosphate dehydrogenase [Collinsella sp. AGMB00827]|uniref:Glycerol-3-phosphate dehydrogenase [NAD(P)+] n=1 Tax=Collinsella ureilytica TaxID=2869515 RepID=A0ABS7MKX5_9ACTN|nr:NAD(P)H-dependent glycerol-3-phosphate dehydrogenase [Collinsella urealyticum]MBY4798014.1 NAD(P)-dependent glycerol-3-phosphate dehydrogenase [Collinsella urealyticum]
MRIALIGAGSWGTAVAGLAAQEASEVRVWAHEESCAAGINTNHVNPGYLTDYTLPENVIASSDIVWALKGADGIIFAVPSMHLRSVAKAARHDIAPDTPVLCLTKGIEPHTGLLMTEVIGEEIGHPERIGALSGPNHAEEVCQGALSAAVIAAEDPHVAAFFKDVLISPAFRVYVSDDITGVEMCGAAKNIMAIICGIAAGSGLGDNTLALIMTRGLAEISRLVHARGGDPMTCMGLAGMGDLVATCTSEHSRNRMFGVAFAQGVSLEAYQERRHMVVEGAAAAMSIAELARSLDVDAPLTFALDHILWHGGSIAESLEHLTDRFPTSEFYGINE